MFTTPFAFMAAQAGGSGIPGNMLSYDFANPASYISGTSVYDLSGNGNTGVFSNADGNNPYVTGGYIVFSGNQFIDVPSSSSLGTSSDLSMEFWVRIRRDNAYILTKGTVPSGGINYLISLNEVYGVGDKRLGFYNYQGGFQYSSFLNVTTENTWAQLVFTWNNSTGDIKGYKNGSLVYSSTGTHNLSAVSGQLTIASYNKQLDEASNWIGDLGIINIFNTVMSDADVLSNFNTYKTRFGL